MKKGALLGLLGRSKDEFWRKNCGMETLSGISGRRTGEEKWDMGY
jgi:hypothetical protein